MTIRDWIQNPPEWGEFGTKATSWLNELKEEVRMRPKLLVPAQDSIMQAGSDVINTGSSTTKVITFPTAFTTLRTVVAINGDTAATIAVVGLGITGQSVTGFTYTFAAAVGICRINWVAVGT